MQWPVSGTRGRALVCTLLVAMSVAAGSLRAQQIAEPAAAPPAELTIADVEARIREVTEGSLEDAVRTQVLAGYNEALENLKRAGEAVARTAEFARQAAEGPALLATIRAELAVSKPPSDPEIPNGATVQDLERILATARAELEAARRQSQDLQKEAGRRDERRGAITTQLAELRPRLAAAEEALLVPAGGELPSPVEAARRAQLRASRTALAAEIAALEQETATFEARREVLPARRDRALRRVAELEPLTAAWERIVNERRQAEARQAEREATAARDNIARKHPALEQIANRNAELAGMRTGAEGLAGRLAMVSSEDTAAREKLASLNDTFRKLRRKLDASGLSKSTGVLLRRHRSTLPSASTLRRRLSEIDGLADDAEFNLVMRQEERDVAGDIDAAVRAIVEGVRADDPSADTATIEVLAAELATSRRDLLDAIIGDYTTYVNRLADVEAVKQDILATSETQLEYVEERILWVKSVLGPLVPTLTDAWEATLWLLDADAWTAAVRAIRIDIRQSKVPWLAFAGLLCLVLLRIVCRRDLSIAATAASSYRTDAFMHSLRAFADTIGDSVVWPAAAFFVGWLLARPLDAPPVATAVGLALEISAFYLLLLELTRAVLRRRGLAEAHFRWPAATIAGLRREFRWFLVVSMPLVVVVVALDRQSVAELWNDSLGRMTFCLAMVVLAFFLLRVFRSKGPVFQQVVKGKGSTHRWRAIWYPAAMVAPIVLVGLALAGYYYTGLQLAQQLIVTGGLVLGLVILRGLLLRWLYVARRRLALEDARRRRAQKSTESPPGAESAPIEENLLNIPAIDAQTQRLFRTTLAIALIVGLYLVWSNVLPALRVLDRVQIWPEMAFTADPTMAEEQLQALPVEPVAVAPMNGSGTSGAASVSAPASTPAPAVGRPMMQTPDPGPSADAVDAPTVLTLADLGFGLLILLITIAAVRNLPAVVEIVVLQRLPLDAGSRYALTTVIRYLILVVGFLAASSALNVSWSKVQWLVAALMFGLAFGLQEIFANLVSGLIILAERPIRVGDAVTVGGVSGTVTRIRARATTVTDWDRKELVVPNKAFVTDQIVNWTLSDPTLRLVVPVGVAYATDIDKTEAALLEVGRDDPSVMKEPPPQVLFKEFGDSTLNFELRVFLPHIEHLVPTRHRLHRAIIKAFRAAGIEIAFPQRDLHIRSADALDELVRKREDLAPGEVPDLRN